MKETAIVKKVEPERVIVECRANADCQGCSRCSVGKGSRIMEAVNRTGEPLHRGDIVEVYFAPSRAIRASFMVLILPLLLFIASYYATGAALPAAGDPLKVLFGFAGVAAGFGVNLLLGRARRDLPEIIARRSGDILREAAGK